MRIRWAKVEDARAIAEVHVASWRAAYRGLFPESVVSAFTAEKWEEHFRKAIPEKIEETAVAEENGRILGYTIIGPSRDEGPEAGNAGEIWGLYIAPDDWKRGIGKELTDWACRELESRGYQDITLWVFEDNLPARKFYERMGFRADSGRKRPRPDAPLAVRYRIKKS